MLAARTEGAVWALDGGVARALTAASSRDLLLVPAEAVLTLAVALPLPSRARRIAALPFAIEERIADRVESVHLALGAQVDGGAHIAGVVDPERMAAWVIAAEQAGLGDAAIMPDALALPIPEPGRWNVLRDAAGRILVRTAEGTGFAAQEHLFLPVWTAAGKPACDEISGFDLTIPIVLDLRQGLFARPRQGMSAIARRVAIVAAAGLLAHGAIAAADTMVLRSLAAKRGAELTSLLNGAAPGRFTGTDPHEAAALATELLPVGGSATPGSLLPMISRTSAALAPFGGAVSVRGLSFDEAGRQLSIDLDLADPGAAAGITKALRDAGLIGRFDGSRLVVSGGVA